MNEKKNNVLSYFQTFFITIIASIFLFFTFDIDFNAYLGIAIASFIFLNISFAFWKNIHFFINYIIVASGNITVFLLRKYFEGFYPVWDKQDIAYVVYLSVLGAFTIIIVAVALRNKKKSTLQLENYFKERKYDLKRLYKYINEFNIIGLDSIWGDGKTYLLKLFEQKYKEEFHFVSIGVMAVTCDSVEKHIISEINTILERKKILSIASTKLVSFLQQPIFNGVGNFLISNSYTELLNAVLLDVNKLEKPILMSFEDIDRINEPQTLHKIFSITEKLAESDKVKVLFQYEEQKLLEVLNEEQKLLKVLNEEQKYLEALNEEKKYIEKHVPFTMNLTPISFYEIVKVLFSDKISHEKYHNIVLEDFQFLSIPLHTDHKLQKLLGLDKEISINIHYSIRKTMLFLKEIDALISSNHEYEKNKKVVIVFFFIKHYMYDIYKTMNIVDRFVDTCSFLYNEKKYNIFELIKLYADNKEAEDDSKNKELNIDLIFEDKKNLNNLLLLHYFGYNFNPIDEYNNESINHSNAEQMYKKKMIKVLNESHENIQKKETNDKIDRLIWSLIAYGKSEYTNLENAVNCMRKVLDSPIENQKEEYKKFCIKANFEDFDKSDISTVFYFDVPNFVSIFQAFRVYEEDEKYWKTLINFYIKEEEVTVIDSKLINVLNYCNISNKNVYLHILSIFNNLEIKGNLNRTECYPRFLKLYLERLPVFGVEVRDLQMIDRERKVLIDDNDFKAHFYNRILNELDKNRGATPLESIKEDIDIVKAFIQKNLELMKSDISLKESVTETKFTSSVEARTNTMIKEYEEQQLSKADLLNDLEKEYNTNNLTVYEVNVIWKHFYSKNK